MQDRILECVSHSLSIPRSQIQPVGSSLFVVQYDAELQPGVRLHTDRSAFSIILPLNTPSANSSNMPHTPAAMPTFEGGGTSFLMLNHSTSPLRPEAGAALVYAGGVLYHAAARISHGQRYVLVGFFDRRDSMGDAEDATLDGRLQLAVHASHEHALTLLPLRSDFYINAAMHVESISSTHIRGPSSLQAQATSVQPRHADAYHSQATSLTGLHRGRGGAEHSILLDLSSVTS